MHSIEDYKYRFFNTSVADIVRAIDGGSLVGGFILTFTSIAALSEIYQSGDYVEHVAEPRSFFGQLISALPIAIQNIFSWDFTHTHSSSKIYRDWVDKWFKKIGRKNPQGWFLYCVRCALAHSYGESQTLERDKIDGYLLVHQKPLLHLEPKQTPVRDGFKPGRIVNLETFVAEYVLAASEFFDQMENLPTVHKQVVLKRLDKLIQIFNDEKSVSELTTVPTTYHDMHPALSALDSKSATAEKLSFAIKELYK